MGNEVSLVNVWRLRTIHLTCVDPVLPLCCCSQALGPPPLFLAL